ncbi:MAG: efflux RND transporter periplasmic adaptor subunit [Anaerolineae bacterium]
MKKKRIWIIVGIVVVLVAAGGVFLATRPAASGQADRFAALLATAQKATVVRTTLANSVDSTGSLSPETTVQLSFGAAGTVKDVNVAVGDHVKQGDVLAALDTTDLELKVKQAEQSYQVQQLTYSNTVQADPADIAVAQASYDNALAALAAAQTDFNNLAAKQSVQCSQLTTAQMNLDRAQTAYDRVANDHQAKQYLVPGGRFYSLVTALQNAQDAYDQAVSNCNIAKLNLNDSALRSARAQVQSAKSSLDDLVSPRTEKQIQAKAQLEQSRLALEQAKNNLADANIVAPFDGVVTVVNVTAGGNSGSSAAITLADVSRLHVDVLVDETQIAAVQVGQQVDLTLDAMSGITLTGQVANIDLTGTVSQGVVNYKVRVNLNPTDTPVLIDMTANASILGERHENVLAVPSTAVRTGGFGAFGGQTGQNGQTGQFGQRGQNGNQTGQTTGQGGQQAAGGQQTNGQTGANGQGNANRQRIQGSFVLVISNGQIRPVQVTTGLTAGDLTEVSGDLQEGEEVLAGELTGANGTRQNGAFFGGPGGGFGGPGAGGPPPF